MFGWRWAVVRVGATETRCMEKCWTMKGAARCARDYAAARTLIVDRHFEVWSRERWEFEQGASGVGGWQPEIRR